MIFFYDFEFNILAVETNIIKSRWVIYYNDIGTFEAHLPITSEITKILSENNYVVVKQHGFSAVIVGFELKDELILYGRTCNWLFSKRILNSVSYDEDFAGEIATKLAGNAFSDVANFSVGTVAMGDKINFSKEEDTAINMISDCLAMSDLGHELRFNDKEKVWEFNVLEGNVNDLVLSEAHRNAYDTGVTFDILDLATSGRYEKKTDSGYVSTSIVGDEDKTGIYRWEAKLLGSNEQEARTDLLKHREKGEASLSVKDILYGRDYRLGDVLRIQILKGAYRKTETKRAKGVEITTKQGVYSEKPIFEQTKERKNDYGV